jgi:chitin synthase
MKDATERQAARAPAPLPGLRIEERRALLPRIPHRPSYLPLTRAEAFAPDAAPVAGGLHMCRQTISLCVTAYNESVDAYHVSIEALARNADYLLKAGEVALSQNMIICIIVDGLAKMAPDFAAWAEALGLYDPRELAADADYHVFESVIDRRQLLRSPADVVADGGAHPGADHAHDAVVSLQKMVLFIKTENRGKLDSHRCFFEILCRYQQPGYFLQVDVGTYPADSALHEMWLAVARTDDVGAVSARSQMPIPKRWYDPLGGWQFGDIAIERTMLWPTEIMMGYMSVLSGQLCFTRADAVWGDPNLEIAARPPESAAPAKVVARDGVIRAYFRGLAALGPFQSNMFLAEDRILGLEIVFQPDSRWRLGYTAEAAATIDACESWNELLCQRRRWICSGIASRLWMFTKVRTYLESPNRSAFQKARIATASLCQGAHTVIQWLAPGGVVLVYAGLLHLATAALPAGGLAAGALTASYLVVLALLAAQLVVSASGRLSAATNRFIGATVGIQMVFIATCTTIAAAGAALGRVSERPLVMILSVASGMALLGAVYARDVTRGWRRSLVSYLLSRPAMAFLLVTHALLNSQNTSWGTKGLNRPHYLDDEADPAKRATMTYRKVDFDRFRNGTVVALAICNVGFVLWGWAQGWFASAGGLELVLGITLVQIGFGLAARVCSWIESARIRAPKSG